MSRGPNVFAVARSIWTDEDFAVEPFTEREAWVWLVSAAAWKDMRSRGNTERGIVLKRGEFSFAVRFLADKWLWTKSRVDRFIQRIEKRDMLRDVSRDGSKIYSIKNYNRFQVVGLPKRDSERDDERNADGTAAGQQRDKEETGETGKQEIEERAAPEKTGAELPGIVSRATIIPPKFPDWIDRAAWDGFVEMRRRKRAPLTARAITQIVGKLELWRARGHDPTAILDKSTENSWTTIYEPTPEGHHGNRPKRPSAHDNLAAGAALFIQSLGTDADESGAGEGGGDADGAGIPLLAPRLLA